MCGGENSGIHYGVIACDLCANFFQKYSNAKYQCRQKKCLIDHTNRNLCNYCWFQKCLDHGMQKGLLINKVTKIHQYKTRSRARSAVARVLESISEYSAVKAAREFSERRNQLPMCKPEESRCRSCQQQRVQLLPFSKMPRSRHVSKDYEKTKN